jgi:hypothetical protein
MKIHTIGLSLLLNCWFLVAPASEIIWNIHELIKEGRIDAIAYLGNGVVVAGTRNPNPGYLFKSTDYGLSWKKITELETTKNRCGITCLESGGEGICYLINESSEFFRSLDYGDTWRRVTKLSYGSNEHGLALSYGICVTKHGSILVSETNSSGASIYRSTDKGLTFTKTGLVSTKALYRFTVIGNTVIVNGWEGVVYKSEDDGICWEKLAFIEKSPLYATEFMGAGEYIQGTESGNIFLGNGSINSCKFLGNPGGAADDFVYLGYGVIIYSTYTDSKSIFISYDKGKHWIDDGIIPTKNNMDWLDHIIRIDLRDSVVIVGGTNKGFIVRTSFSREYLYNKTYEYGKNSNEKNLIKSIESGLMGFLTDFTELDEPEDVLIDGKFAYVPCRVGNNLAVMDISNPKMPFLAYSFRDPELIDAMGVAKHGQYLYLTSMSNHKCLVLDTTDPTNLKKVKSFVVGGEESSSSRVLRKVVFYRDYLYLTDSREGTLYIADAHKPESPVIISRVETGDGAFAVLVKDNYAYVGGCFPGSSLIVIDVGDKIHPKVVEILKDTEKYDCLCSFQNTGNNLYAVAYSSNSFIQFDINDPLNIKEKEFLQNNQLNGPNRLILMGNRAYVINAISDSFIELDIGNNIKPKINYIVYSRLLEKAYGITSNDNLLYIVGRDSKSFLIIDP